MAQGNPTTPSRLDSSNSGDEDWSGKATEAIVSLIDQVRDKSVGPAVTIARGIVYGLVAAVVGLVCLVMLTVGLVRLLEVYLPGDVWSAYLLLGLIFVAAGLFIWTKRTP